MSELNRASGEGREHELEQELKREFKREERTERELEKVHELEHQLEQELEEEHKEEEKLESEIEAERPHHHAHYSLVFVLNGEDIDLRVNPEASLSHAVEKALIDSGNSGRKNPSEWELRDAAGKLLDMQRSAKDLGLVSGTRLYLSLRVGAGG
jgi:hypothetical protein